MLIIALNYLWLKSWKFEGSLINDILLINGSSELKNLKINEEEWWSSSRAFFKKTFVLTYLYEYKMHAEENHKSALTSAFYNSFIYQLRNKARTFEPYYNKKKIY